MLPVKVVERWGIEPLVPCGLEDLTLRPARPKQNAASQKGAAFLLSGGRALALPTFEIANAPVLMVEDVERLRKL